MNLKINNNIKIIIKKQFNYLNKIILKNQKNEDIIINIIHDILKKMSLYK